MCVCSPISVSRYEHNFCDVIETYSTKRNDLKLNVSKRHKTCFHQVQVTIKVPVTIVSVSVLFSL